MAVEDEILERLETLNPSELDQLLGRLDLNEKRALLQLLADRMGADDVAPGGSGDKSPRDEACAYLDRDGLKYSITSQGSISLKFTHNHTDEITVFVNVHDSYDIYIRTSDLVSYDPRRHNEALQLTADLNKEYRYAKFCLDDDNTIHAEADLPGRDDGGDALDMLAKFIRRVERIARDGKDEKLVRLS